MPKVIRVSDEAYDKLKKLSEAEVRPISSEIIYLVDQATKRQQFELKAPLSPEAAPEPQPLSQEAQDYLKHLDDLYNEAMSKPKPTLNHGLLTPEEIEKYSGQNIIVN